MSKDHSSVERQAAYLATKLDDKVASNRKFYLKVTYNLSEGEIQYILETAQKGRNPKALFASLAKKKMDEKQRN